MLQDMETSLVESLRVRACPSRCLVEAGVNNAKFIKYAMTGKKMEWDTF